MGSSLTRTCAFSLDKEEAYGIDGQEQDAPPLVRQNTTFWHEPFRAVFSKLDRDNNGVVDRIEFINALNRDEQVRDFLHMPEVDYEPKSFETFAEVFRDIDKDVDNTLTWNEFLEYFAQIRPLSVADKPQLPAEQFDTLLALFQKMDTDNSGELSREEFTTAARNDARVREFLHIPLPHAHDDDTLQYVFNELDADHNDSISWNHFLTYIARRQRGKTLSELKKEQENKNTSNDEQKKKKNEDPAILKIVLDQEENHSKEQEREQLLANGHNKDNSGEASGFADHVVALAASDGPQDRPTKSGRLGENEYSDEEEQSGMLDEMSEDDFQDKNGQEEPGASPRT